MADNYENSNRFSEEEIKNANSLSQSARTLTEELKDQLGIRSRLNETQKETLSLARQLQRSAQENTVEIGNNGNIESQINKDLKLRNSLKRELYDVSKNISKEVEMELEMLKEASELGEESYIRAFAAADQETQKIALLEKSVNLSEDILNQRAVEAEIQKDINQKMGVTGALVKGTGALMERLGMRSGIFQDTMKEAASNMRNMAEETVRGEKSFSRLQIMAKGFSTLATGFGKALFDPFTITTAIVSKFFELNKASTQLQRLTGQTADLQAAHNNELVSGAQVMEQMAFMTERTGIAASAIFTADDLGRIAEAKNLLGLSSEQASNLGMFSKVSGTSIQGYKEELVASVNEFNAMNDSAVAHGVVMKDVLDASADVSMSLGGNPKKIAAAASAARKLGLDLAKVNQIADGLLDFESSIGSELEAQLLTGKNINMSKARELALNNDLEGLAEELAKNGASAAEFAKMNRIQQQSMAKALGMSREEMGKMLINQEGQKNLSKEQRAAMRGVTLEQLEQMEASEALQLAFSKIAEPLASILSTLAPILTNVAKLVSLVAPVAPYILLAVKGFQLFNSGILDSIKNMGKLITKTGLFGKFYKGGQFMPGGGRAKAGGERGGGLFSKVLQKSDKGKEKLTDTGDKVSKVAKKTKAVPPGKNIKSFLNNLAQGLTSMGTGKVLFGALNLIPASIGFIAMIPGAIGMAAIAALGKPTAMGLQALGKGLTSFGIAMMGPGGVGLLAFVGAAIGLGAAFALVGAGAMMFGKGIEFAANGVVKIFNGLTGLISSIPQLYLLGGALMSIAAGLGAIAFAGISAIPALAALGTLAVMSAPLVALGGMFDNGDDGGDNSEMITLLKEIRDEVKKGGDVLLDGNKVGEALVLGSYISS